VLARMLKYLYTHGRHLESYLSTYFSPNTHLTGEAVGLLYLGVLLPEFSRARQWRRLGWRILQEQLGRQIRPDGVYFEQASYYHRYTIDIYLNAIMLGEHNGIPLPQRMRSRLELAAAHLADLTRPDGTIPMIGDDDGGSLLVLEQRDFADVRATLASASLVFEKPEWAVVAGKATEEVLWLFGPEGLKQVDRTIAGEPPAHQSRLFPVGGYAIMRDGWGPTAKHAVIDCGPLGEANCGHAHSDLLSIEIAVAGAPVLVDTGTFTYTASAADRDAFRHSSAHNTLTVDGESAAVPDGPFSWSLKTAAKAESWWTGGLVDRLVASHAGFRRLPDPATHRRTVYFVRGEYWIIVDSLLAAGTHETTAHYHFAPGTIVTPDTPAAVRLETTGGEARQSLFFAVTGDVDEVKWEQGWVSPSYGSRTEAPYARAISRGTGRRDIISVLCPVTDGARVSVSEVEAEGGRAVVVDRQGTYDVVMIPSGGEMRMPGVALHGDGAWVRRASADAAPEALALFGADSRITVAGVEVTASLAAEARRTGGSWVVEGEGRAVVHE
ncbi:MAG: alginate lyase family protein, partial [Gemmatimonadaceae bacterium]